MGDNMREWLTDKEKRILFSALTREKKVCIEEDKKYATEMGRTNSNYLQSICESLEDKFYYDSLFKQMEKQIRTEAIDDFADRLKSGLNKALCYEDLIYQYIDEMQEKLKEEIEQ